MAGRTAILAIRIISDSKKAAADFDATGTRAQRMADRVQGAGKVAGRALALGFAAAGAAAVKFGQQASDLAETQSKVNQIFGKQGAAALDKFASSAATALGQSKQQALDAAATFGTFGNAAGLTGTELAGFSTKLTALASDMASFSNTSPQEAIEALAAGLRGEAEPLRKYGILLDDASLRAQALKMGLIATTKQALTPQQKVLASQALIMQQTTKAQGDFARTSEGLANKQRILKAQMTNLSTEIGAKALPAMVKLTAAGLAVVNWIDRNRTTAAILIGVVVGLTAAVYAVSLAMKVAAAAQAAWTAITVVASTATKVAAAGQWALNAALAANPIGLVILAVVALVAAIVIAYKKSETFRNIVQAVGKLAAAAFGWIVDKVKDVAEWVGTNAPKAFEAMKNVAVRVFDALTAPIRTVIGLVKDLIGFFDDKIPVALGVLKTVMETVGSALLAPFKALKDLIQGVIDKIKSIKLPDLPDLNPFSRAAVVGGGTVATASPVVVQLHMSGSFVGNERQLAEQLAPVFEKTLQRIARR